MYALSLYAIMRGINFYSLLNAMYLLPFLLILLEDLIDAREQRRYAAAAKFALLIMVQTCCSFYFLYLQTIFLVIYAFVYYCKVYGGKIKAGHLWGKVFEIALYYVLGVLASGMVLLPTLRGFFHSSRALGEATSSYRLFFTFKELLKMLGNLVIPMFQDDHYGLAIPCLGLMAVVVYLVSFKKCIHGKILTCLCVAAYLCPLVWSITNGFSYETDRWNYILYFGASYLTVLVMEKYVKGELSNKLILCAFIPAGLSVLLHLVLHGDKIRCAVYLMMIVVCGAVLVRCKLKEKHILWMISGCSLVMILFLIAPWQVCGYEIWNMGSEQEDVAALTEQYSLAQQDTFVRRDVRGASVAESIVAGYMGVEEYFSILNGNIFDFWKQLMISPGICMEPHRLEGLNARKPLESLLSVSEYQDKEQMVENDLMLPFGVQYEEAVSDQYFEELSPLQKQHTMMQKVVLADSESVEAEVVPEDAVSDWEPVELDYESDWGNIQREGNYLEAEGGDTLTLTIDTEGLDDEQGELYVYFEDFQCFLRWTSQIEVNGWEFSVQNRTSPYYTGAEDFLVHVSVPKDGKLEVSFLNGNQFELHDISVFWYNYEGLAEDVDTLRAHCMQNVMLEKDRINGDIEAKDGWLFLSVPYSSEWRAYVDGEETEIVKANIGFMAVQLDAGEHHVELVYRPISFAIGVICTIVGLAAILCLFYLERRKNR